MKKNLFIFQIAAIVLFASRVFAEQGHLTVTVDNIESSKGSIMIGVCAGEEEFAGKKPYSYGFFFDAKIGSITETVSIPAGKYALIVYHDENRNKILDRAPSGKPLEKYGFSNNFFGLFGKNPPFEKTLITVTQSGSTVKINLRN